MEEGVDDSRYAIHMRILLCTVVADRRLTHIIVDATVIPITLILPFHPLLQVSSKPHPASPNHDLHQLLAPMIQVIEEHLETWRGISFLQNLHFLLLKHAKLKVEALLDELLVFG